jgi:hypothetical protein
VPETSPRLTRAFAALASAGFATALVCAWGWYRAARERTDLSSLSPEERQELTREMLAVSPGAFVQALFEPAVGYTLRPKGKITAWGDTFQANEIGYRTGPLPGRRGGRKAFRIVFLGDSWTFGMGVREPESFPARVAELANRLGAADGRTVEAFNLGLPGYNTLNEIAALDFFWDRLRPDAVVICPTANDADSTANVLPNGSLTLMGIERDGFGSDHPLVFPRLADSFEFRSRWRRDFDAIHSLEERLRVRGVPLLVYFAATWDEPFAHALVQGSGVTSPYVITPRRLASPRWRNPPPFFHGTPEANRLYAHMVYRGLAGILGWPAPPLPEEKDAQVPVHRHPPAGAVDAARELLAKETAKIPESYVPGRPVPFQCTGPMDCRTGLAGKATTILVRRRPGATAVEVTLRRLPNAPSILPLPVRVSIPWESNGTEARAVLTEGGPDPLIVSIPIPPGVPAGAALDVTIRAARVVSAPAVVAPRSLFIAGIEQIDPMLKAGGAP